MSVIDKIILNGTTYELGGSSGEGLSTDLKAAMDQIAQKVAYIDANGQTYYNALHSALYPPANLSYITCVYTQSGTVYDTDTLDSLKSDLVVTAHYDNSTTEVVTSYTLSGTLTVGTSTITVAYGGKTATFTVTVTEKPEEALYPLHDIDNYTATYQTLSISGGNHITRTTTSNSRVVYVGKTDASGVHSSNRQAMFGISAGSSYSLKIKNIVFTENSSDSNYIQFQFLDSSNTVILGTEQIAVTQTGESTIPDVTVTGTISAAANITELYMFSYRSSSFTCDIELRVNGTKYI